MEFSTKHARIALAKVFAAAGAAYCFWIPNSSFMEACETGICESTKNASILGVSNWTWGAIAFLILLFRPKLAAFFLFCDFIFLAVMAGTAMPCGFCLIAGAFFFAVFLAAENFREISRNLESYNLKARMRSSLAFCAPFAWSALFLINIGVLWGQGGYENIGAPKSPVSVWFCPDCAACERALAEHPGAKLYPVVENGCQAGTISLMRKLMDKGAPPAEALRKAREERPETPSLGETYVHNRAFAMEHGGKLPIIMETPGSDAKNHLDDFLNNFGRQ